MNVSRIVFLLPVNPPSSSTIATWTASYADAPPVEKSSASSVVTGLAATEFQRRLDPGYSSLVRYHLLPSSTPSAPDLSVYGLPRTVTSAPPANT